MKNKNIFIKQICMVLIALAIVSCNDDDNFRYDMPEQAELASVDLSIAQSTETVCTVDMSLTTTTDDVSVYYLFAATQAESPTSSDVFDQGEMMYFGEASTQTITSPSLLQLSDYTLYAVTVNEDGLRSEQVFMANYSTPAFDVNIDTDYSGESYIGTDLISEGTTTLTPTADSNVFLVDTCWGANFVADATGNAALQGQYLYSGTLTINADNSITIVGDEAWGPGGTGAYDPCSNMITYSLVQGLFSGDFTVDVTLTPNNL